MNGQHLLTNVMKMLWFVRMWESGSDRWKWKWKKWHDREKNRHTVISIWISSTFLNSISSDGWKKKKKRKRATCDYGYEQKKKKKEIDDLSFACIIFYGLLQSAWLNSTTCFEVVWMYAVCFSFIICVLIIIIFFILIINACDSSW